MYILSLSNGQSWGIPSAGETRRWADEFARLLGLPESQGRPDCVIRLEGFPQASGAGGGGFGVPPLGCSGQGWRALMFPLLEIWCREGFRENVCRLRGTDDPRRIREQMRHALIPLYQSALCRGGLPLHAALVERDGRGMLLIGKSGAGKSTACRRLPPGWTVLGDDLALAMRNREEKFVVHPLPTWSRVGSGSRDEKWDIQHSVELSAIFFLAQAAHDEVLPAGSAAAAVMLAHAAETIFNSVRTTECAFGAPSLKGEIFANAADMARSIPAYILRLSLTGLFWETIEQVLEPVETRDREAEKFSGIPKENDGPR